MALYDTSNIIDESIFLKGKLDKNMVGTNYYIENLQEKRNADWEYRYNVVDIEEEKEKQIEYTKFNPNYTPIEVVINNVKNEKGKDMGIDWAKIVFKDLQHPCGIGYRYRFSLDFPDMLLLTEEEKQYQTSIWIGINQNPIKAGNSCIVRRCNSHFVFVGSPTLERTNISEIHKEPCILENSLRFVQLYINEVLPIPQSEWYAVLQMNYFTKSIQINDRFLIGVKDYNNKGNNLVLKVKAIVQGLSSLTFSQDNENDLKNTPLIILALDKDLVSSDDDIENNIAVNTTIYQTEEIESYHNYQIKTNDDAPSRLLLGEEEIYTFNLIYNQQNIDSVFNFEAKIPTVDTSENFFQFEQINNNSFKIKNLRTCSSSPVIITASTVCPNGKKISEDYKIELGSFY